MGGSDLEVCVWRFGFGGLNLEVWIWGFAFLEVCILGRGRHAAFPPPFPHTHTHTRRGELGDRGGKRRGGMSAGMLPRPQNVKGKKKCKMAVSSRELSLAAPK